MKRGQSGSLCSVGVTSPSRGRLTWLRSHESRCVLSIPLVRLAVLLLQADLLTQGRDEEHHGEQGVGDPQEVRVGDDAQAQEEDVVAEVLRVSGEPVGAGGVEAVPHARRVLSADGDDSPDRQQSSQQSQRDAGEEPEVAWEDRGVPVEKGEGSVESGG